MVQLYLNNQLCDLYGSEEIATDYAIAPIANIASRTGAKSVSFKIPLTANNREIIENANVIVNDTTLPYQLIPVQLKANGLDQNLEFAQIKSIKDDISLSLFGSNIDFFSIIKGLKLEDLDNDYDHVWNLVNAHGSAVNTSGYIYGIIDYLATPNAAYIDDTDKEIDVRGLLPSVYLHSLISQIITEAGFTASGNFLTNANYKSVIIPCLSTKIGRYADQLNARAEQSTDSITPYLELDETIYDPLGIISEDTFNAGGIFGVVTAWVYNVQFTGTYSIQARVYFDNIIGSVDATLWKTAGGVSTVIDVQPYIGTVDYADFDLTGVELTQDDKVWITLTGTGSGTTGAGGYLHITENDIEETTFGKIFDVPANLPDMNQSDLLKDTCQKFGLILQVNNQTKVVSIRQFSEIIDNIPNALDWSDKVDYTEKPEIEFESDYARRNLCTYKADDSVVKPVGTDSEILIDNDNLEAEKELFESPFAASEQVLRFGGYSIAQIKYFTDIGTADESLESVEPRYLIRRTETFSIFTYTDGTSDLTATEVPLTHFILSTESFNAGFENNLLNNSSDLIAMIQNFRLVKMLLRNNASDINQLDFFTPVWIQIKGQPGCYFYISEIKQFKVTSKESTEVSLGKLIT